MGAVIEVIVCFFAAIISDFLEFAIRGAPDARGTPAKKPSRRQRRARDREREKEKAREDVLSPEAQDLERTLKLVTAGSLMPVEKHNLLSIGFSSLSASPDLYWNYVCTAVRVAADRFGITALMWESSQPSSLVQLITATRPKEYKGETCASPQDISTAVRLIQDFALSDDAVRHERFDYGNFRADDLVERAYGPMVRLFATLAAWDGARKNIPKHDVGDELVETSTDAYVEVFGTAAATGAGH